MWEAENKLGVWEAENKLGVWEAENKLGCGRLRISWGVWEAENKARITHCTISSLISYIRTLSSLFHFPEIFSLSVSVSLALFTACDNWNLASGGNTTTMVSHLWFLNAYSIQQMFLNAVSDPQKMEVGRLRNEGTGAVSLRDLATAHAVMHH